MARRVAYCTVSLPLLVRSAYLWAPSLPTVRPFSPTPALSRARYGQRRCTLLGRSRFRHATPCVRRLRRCADRAGTVARISRPARPGACIALSAGTCARTGWRRTGGSRASLARWCAYTPRSDRPGVRSRTMARPRGARRAWKPGSSARMRGQDTLCRSRHLLHGPPSSTADAWFFSPCGARAGALGGVLPVRATLGWVVRDVFTDGAGGGRHATVLSSAR